MSLTTMSPDEIAARLYPNDRVCRPLPDPSAFGEEHLEQYRRDGFIAIENVYSSAEVEAAKAGLTFLIAGGNPEYTGVQIEDSMEGKKFASDEERESYV